MDHLKIESNKFRHNISKHMVVQPAVHLFRSGQVAYLHSSWQECQQISQPEERFALRCTLARLETKWHVHGSPQRTTFDEILPLFTWKGKLACIGDVHSWFVISMYFHWVDNIRTCHDS
jgi:hypothetical protein